MAAKGDTKQNKLFNPICFKTEKPEVDSRYC